MKKSAFLLVALVVTVFTGFAQSPADKCLGVWLSEDKATKIELFKVGSTYTGKLLWAKDLYKSDGKTSRKDDQNANPTLRSCERKGLVIIAGLTYTDGAYAGGTYYNVDNGGEYSCKMEQKEGKLYFRGYKVVPAMGKTFVWTRVP